MGSRTPGIHKSPSLCAGDTLSAASSPPNAADVWREIAGRSCRCNGPLLRDGRHDALPRTPVETSERYLGVTALELNTI